MDDAKLKEILSNHAKWLANESGGSGADLSSADLSGADLSSANLYGAKPDDKTKGWGLAVARTRILPEGSIIGWKKCQNNVIVKVLVPCDAKRSHAFRRKCRAEYVHVLELFNGHVGISTHDNRTKYEVGGIVRCDKWDDNWQVECGGGIHFFLTREEAEAFN